MPASPPAVDPVDDAVAARRRPARQARLRPVDLLVVLVVVVLVGGLAGARRFGLDPRQPTPSARRTATGGSGSGTATAAPGTPAEAEATADLDPALAAAKAGSSAAAPTTVASAVATAPAAPADPAAHALASALAVSPTPVAPVPFAVRTPSARRPLQLLVVGDALAGGLSRALGRLGAVDGTFTARDRSVPSSGLARPEVFDWPGQIASVVVPDDELVVIALGLNDAQALSRTATSTGPVGSSAWRGAYLARLDGLIDGAGPRPVVVVGLPAVESPARDRELQPIREALAAAAGRHANVRYLDLNARVSDGGTFQRWLDRGDGQQIAARSNDGEQFTDDGNDLAAAALVADVWPAPGG